MTDALAALEARLAELDDSPVDAHPDALEQLQRAIVDELDSLATGRPNDSAED